MQTEISTRTMKKTVSDLKELKGLLSGDIQSPEPERSLKKGQRVVLMDSNMKGTVVSIGDTVGIEIDDGFVIQVSYGEFAPADPEEDRLLARSSVCHGSKTGRVSVAVKGSSGMSGGLPARNVRYASPGHMEVDLHMESMPGGRSVPAGRQLEFQMSCFRNILRANLCHRGMRITFIHGVGDGVLRGMIVKDLDEVFAVKCTYSSSPAYTTVTVR